MGEVKLRQDIIPENIPKKQQSDRLDDCHQVETYNIDALSIYAQKEEDEEIINDTKAFPPQKNRVRWQGLIVGIGIGVVATVASMQLVSRPKDNSGSETIPGNSATQTVTNAVENNLAPTMSVTVAAVELATSEPEKKPDRLSKNRMASAVPIIM
ncbi:MAG: hypothetical protein F6K17_34915, partial [Okeania sp. SIO3C4]|nr:hypothetical protein [Okeania sp. SIO3C4]